MEVFNIVLKALSDATGLGGLPLAFVALFMLMVVFKFVSSTVLKIASICTIFALVCLIAEGNMDVQGVEAIKGHIQSSLDDMMELFGGYIDELSSFFDREW
ncbi:hypothetical protein [Vibrio sp. D431a]|uniref:hypothetical protein n=1 Tax=Vibrio sp. D431a TaxID=2837388 RepID=UPI0025568F18|nr:hypothetical protein [Vibrio sp. D431a]MDK9790662.1 hypothetical protein [Vibrio sp. D431a]